MSLSKKITTSNGRLWLMFNEALLVHLRDADVSAVIENAEGKQ
jgi:hypothetical protein